MRLVNRHHVYTALCDALIGGKADCRSVLVSSSSESDMASLRGSVGKQLHRHVETPIL